MTLRVSSEGQSRKFGFVGFADPSSAKAAMWVVFAMKKMLTLLACTSIIRFWTLLASQWNTLNLLLFIASYCLTLLRPAQIHFLDPGVNTLNQRHRSQKPPLATNESLTTRIKKHRDKRKQRQSRMLNY